MRVFLCASSLNNYNLNSLICNPPITILPYLFQLLALFSKCNFVVEIIKVKALFPFSFIKDSPGDFCSAEDKQDWKGIG